MQILRPTYYDQFRCLAGTCPDSCCHEWTIVVDEDAAQMYRSLPGELGDRLRAAMEEEEGDIILRLTPKRRCPMWREDGLCRIQAALGEGALCQTCHQFPRLRHDYGDFVELGLELSCPEAARLILAGQDAPLIQTEPEDIAPEYDTEAMQILKTSREAALALLDDPQWSPNEALAILLLYGYSVQNQLDGGEAAILSPAEDLLQAKNWAGSANDQDFLNFFAGLEILTDRWRTRLANPQGSSWSEAHRRLARYFISRY